MLEFTKCMHGVHATMCCGIGTPGASWLADWLAGWLVVGAFFYHYIILCYYYCSVSLVPTPEAVRARREDVLVLDKGDGGVRRESKGARPRHIVEAVTHRAREAALAVEAVARCMHHAHAHRGRQRHSHQV